LQNKKTVLWRLLKSLNRVGTKLSIMKKISLQIKVRALSTFLTLTLLLMFSPVFGQNFVQNGSFELSSPLVTDTTLTGAYITLGGTNTLTNWPHTGTVDVHSYRHWNMGCPAGGDTQHIDLNLNGSITQTISGMATGAKYVLSFYTSVHAKMFCTGNASATVKLGSIVNETLNLTSANKPWTQHAYTFTATSTSAVLSFQGDSSCYEFGGVLIDLVSITPFCDNACQDDDWYEVGTTTAPMSINANAYRMANAAIGTGNPVWNFKLTIDNREDVFQQNNNRNAIHATAMHTDCSFGYGILVNTNPLGGTKAVAVQGNGMDRAVIYGNGKSWFSNTMSLGGPPPPVEVICPDAISEHILIINGTGVINGMFISSDSRFKDNIEPIENTDEIIKKLNPVAYQYKTDEFKDRNFPAGNTYGFIAQELNEVLPDAVNKERDGYYSVNYIALIPVLTKAIKDQQTEIEALKAKVEEIAEVNKMQGSIEGTPAQKVEINKTAMLMQNTPNPLNDVTFIDYYLPASATSAFIKVTDNNGRLIQAFPINKTGYGQLELNCINMASGTYYYSLLIDNNVIDTKTMVISKN
jgi:hypothetical protein